LQKIVNKSLGPDDSIKKTPKIVNKKDSKRPWADFLTLGLCASQLKVVKPEKKWKLLTSNEIWPQQNEVDKLRCAYP
jgi:hypothetical protein